MKTEMTARDKKLLVFLVIFVIVVCVGYWGIRPMVKDITQFNDDIAEAEAQKETDDMKLTQLPVLAKENEYYEESILEARTDFYPMMTSDEIDKMFTGMVLDYNLQSYSLDIAMPDSESELDAYRYSKKYMEPQSVETDISGISSSDYEALDSIGEEEELFIDDDTSAETGIYTVGVKLEVAGDPAWLQKLIDDLSASDKKHLLKNYAWSEERGQNVVFGEDNTYSVEHTVEHRLNLSIDLFMCQN